MSESIRLNDQVSISLEKLIQSRLVILANSGSGKSWLIRRMAEQAAGKVQTIIIDPEGEFSSLRDKYDFVLCGKGMEAPAEPKSAAMLAETLLETGASAIIDLYELHPQDRQRFVKIFCEALVNAPKKLHNHNCLVILDEAHDYVPEGKPSEATYAVESLASKGRKRFLCLILASQRISKISKNATAECNNKLIGRASQDTDYLRAGAELGFNKKDSPEKLRNLKPGEFYAFGPAISDDIVKMKVGEVRTSHGKVGYATAGKPIPTTEKLKKILGRIAEIPKEAEKQAVTISGMQQEIRKLIQENGLLKRQSKITDTGGEIQVRKAVEDELRRHKIAFGSVENAYKNQIQEWKRFTEKLMGRVLNIGKTAGEICQLVMPKEDAGVRYAPERTKYKALPVKTPTAPVSAVSPSAPEDQGEPKEFNPSASQDKILSVLVWMESLNMLPADKSQVALLADQSPTSGGYFNNIGALRTAGMIEYPTPGMVTITDKGRGQAKPAQIPGNTGELHEQLFKKLSASQVAILKMLIEIYPEPISKAELADRSGQSPTSGGYFNNLGRLRSLKLIDYPTPGIVAALPVLFL